MNKFELKPCPYCGCAAIDMASAKWNTGEERYFASCCECDASGPTCADDVSTIAEMRAAEAWDALPRPLRWTSEPPTVPGWYWQRGGESEEPRVVPVVWGRADSGEMELRICCNPYAPLSRYEWAGPIPEPQE